MSPRRAQAPAPNPDAPPRSRAIFEKVGQSYEPAVPVEQLRAHPENPRRGSVGAILTSIEAHGFYGAVLAQRSTGHVLAGNHRLAAAVEAGMTEIPVMWVDVDDDQARRILLADNRASDLASYDEAALAALLGSLEETAKALAGTLFDGGDPGEWTKLGYRSVDTSVPLRLGHYLVSYPLELHGQVVAALDGLASDDRVRMRHGTSPE